MSSCDVLVVGGAATGSATAHHLLRLAPDLDVVVVEPDPTYARCSTLLSDGNLRYQFHLPENIAMSAYLFGLLDGFADDLAVGDHRPVLAPTHQGNLFLCDEAGRDEALAGLAVQRGLGADVAWLEVDEIRARWPQLGVVDPVVGGTFGPRDGPIDPTALLDGFRRDAVHRGATYVADTVTALTVAGERVTGATLAAGGRVTAGAVVVAAGAWSPAITATVGVHLPVEPVMRTVHVVEHDPALGAVPSVFLPDGTYALPDGATRSQVSWSSEADPVGFDFTYRRAGLEDVVWPRLVSVCTGYEQLRHVGGWCGLYAMNTLDANAILGAWPGLDGLYVACGFSGHGFQHTPAMGRHLAELVTGTTPSLDLSRLGPQRILDGEPLHEHAGRII